jgi:hypothetical protein
MNCNFQDVILQATGVYPIEDIQSLWSGYGQIMRYGLRGGDRQRVVVKHVKLPDAQHHPLAWTDFHRFMKGWSPGHWKIHGYSERLARQVLAQLKTAVSE